MYHSCTRSKQLSHEQILGASETWEEYIPWIRSQTDLELWVKGGQFHPAKPRQP